MSHLTNHRMKTQNDQTNTVSRLDGVWLAYSLHRLLYTVIIMETNCENVNGNKFLWNVSFCTVPEVLAMSIYLVCRSPTVYSIKHVLSQRASDEEFLPKYKDRPLGGRRRRNLLFHKTESVSFYLCERHTVWNLHLYRLGDLKLTSNKCDSTDVLAMRTEVSAHLHNSRQIEDNHWQGWVDFTECKGHGSSASWGWANSTNHSSSDNKFYF